MSWPEYILQNYFPSLPNFSLLLNKHAKFQMRRIWTLDPAVIPDASEFCVEGSVLCGPFINEADVVKKVIFSTWHYCRGLTPNPLMVASATLLAHLVARVSSLAS